MPRSVPISRISTGPAPDRRTRASKEGLGAVQVRFTEFLAGKGLKLTRQREQVLREIAHEHGHFEADELAQRMRKRDARVSRATVYRTLDLLLECMIVEKINFGTTRSFYEYVREGTHHDHMVCTRCGEIIEFYDNRVEDLQEEIAKKHGMALTHHSMRLFGVCAKCR